MDGKWITSWGMAHTGGNMIGAKTGKCTTHTEIISGISGSRMRLLFSNQYGSKPLALGRVTIETKRGRRQILFAGDKQIVIQPGTRQYSDEITLSVTAGEKVHISIYYASSWRPVSGNVTFTQTHSTKGDFTTTAFIPQSYTPIAPKVLDTNFPEPLATLAALEVYSEGEDSCAIAAFGDSITQNGRWVDPLRERIHTHFHGHVTLINLGIWGNRLLKDTNVTGFKQIYGRAGIKRTKWDILSLQSVRYVMVALGINDITQPGNGIFSPPEKEICTAEELIEGYRQIIQVCHLKGIKVIGCTITPFGGCPNYKKDLDQIRREANQWILTSGEFDKTLDFASMIANPKRPSFLFPDYDNGDHLHPSPEGGKKIAESIPLSVFE